MRNIKNEILELVNKIEMEENVYDNVNIIIKKLSDGLKNGEIEEQFAKEIDVKLGLEYFC